MPRRERPKSWQRFLESFRIADNENELESTPLLGSDQIYPSTRAPQRIITGDGAAIVLYPQSTDSLSNPASFSLELPAALEDILPSPIYRSHVAALNALLVFAHGQRRQRYLLVYAFLASLVITTGALGVWFVVGANYWGAAACIGGLVVLLAIQPFVGKAWFADLADSVETEVARLLNEWNARAPKNVQFRILGAATLVVHPWCRLSDDSLEEPQLQIILLDSSRRESELGRVGPSDVLITPDGDGMMLSVKVISRIPEETSTREEGVERMRL